MVRTVCSEATEVVNMEVGQGHVYMVIFISLSTMEVCAVSYQQRKVSAEIKTVQAVFEKSCQDEQVASRMIEISSAYPQQLDCLTRDI